jgi:hypothetical protein
VNAENPVAADPVFSLYTVAVEELDWAALDQVGWCGNEGEGKLIRFRGPAVGLPEIIPPGIFPDLPRSVEVP